MSRAGLCGTGAAGGLIEFGVEADGGVVDDVEEAGQAVVDCSVHRAVPGRGGASPRRLTVAFLGGGGGGGAGVWKIDLLVWSRIQKEVSVVVFTFVRKSWKSEDVSSVFVVSFHTSTPPHVRIIRHVHLVIYVFSPDATNMHTEKQLHREPSESL